MKRTASARCDVFDAGGCKDGHNVVIQRKAEVEDEGSGMIKSVAGRMAYQSFSSIPS